MFRDPRIHPKRFGVRSPLGRGAVLQQLNQMIRTSLAPILSKVLPTLGRNSFVESQIRHRMESMCDRVVISSFDGAFASEHCSYATGCLKDHPRVCVLALYGSSQQSLAVFLIQVKFPNLDAWPYQVALSLDVV